MAAASSTSAGRTRLTMVSQSIADHVRRGEVVSGIQVAGGAMQRCRQEQMCPDGELAVKLKAPGMQAAELETDTVSSSPRSRVARAMALIAASLVTLAVTATLYVHPSLNLFAP